MNIKDLKCFEAVYEQKSINKAAKQLYITPQGLGSNIRSLENELGTVLFERAKQGVTPTESAQLLYKRAGLLIEEFEQIRNEVQQLSHREDVLRIGCACGVFNVIPFKLIQDLSLIHILKEVLKGLEGILDDKTMADLNYQVEGKGKEPKDVAHEFLKAKGFVR